MHIFLVERYWPGVTEEEFADAARRLQAAAVQMLSEGVNIRFVRSTYMREEETVFDVFEASSPAAAAQASERAQLRCDRIVEALEAYPDNDGVAISGNHAEASPDVRSHQRP